MHLSKKLLILVIVLAASACFAYAQETAITDSSYAKNALGIGISLNTGAENNATIAGMGFGGTFQAQVRLSKCIALLPSVGAEVPHGLLIGLGGRFFATRNLYIQPGGFLQLAGDGFDNSGLRPTGSLGYELYTGKFGFFDFNFHYDYLNVDGRMKGIGGLRVTYNFILSKIASALSADGKPVRRRRLSSFPPLPFN